MILRMWAGANKDGNYVGTFLGKGKAGLRLAEHERHDFTIFKEDLIGITPENDVHFDDLWFEDTLGRRHFVKNAKANIQSLRAS